MEENLINKVAAGLRRMKRQPDFFLFLDNYDWTYDLNDMGGIKVLHTTGLRDECDYSGPFVPVWFDEHSDNAINRKLFIDGYFDED